MTDPPVSVTRMNTTRDLTELISEGYSVTLVPTDDSEPFHVWDEQGLLALYYDPRTGGVGTYDDHDLQGIATYRLIPVMVRQPE